MLRKLQREEILTSYIQPSQKLQIKKKKKVLYLGTASNWSAIITLQRSRLEINYATVADLNQILRELGNSPEQVFALQFFMLIKTEQKVIIKAAIL